MGCGSSRNSMVSPLSFDNSLSSMKWKEKKTKKQRKAFFVKEGTILPTDSADLLELRMHLEDPVLLKQVGQYAIRKCKFEMLMCWADILEFMYIPEAAIEYQISKGMHIYHKYLGENAPVVLQVSFSPEKREKIHLALKNAQRSMDDIDPTGLPRQLFCDLQRECLVGFYDGVFKSYKNTFAFKAVVQHVRQSSNVVQVDDFDYLELLGYGTFGFVMHCVKKSTGKHYAMKVQSKKGLLQTYCDCLARVTLEKDVVATCHHPFIVSMDYAFQTKFMVMMVMDLGTAGTLLDASEMCTAKQMNLERVRFYAAEIYLALAHIHRLGLIYRDLKPANVLLWGDGHIKLVDLGGIVDVGSSVVGYNCAEEQMGGLFAPDYRARIRRYESDQGQSDSGITPPNNGSVCELPQEEAHSTTTQSQPNAQEVSQQSDPDSVSNMELKGPSGRHRKPSRYPMAELQRASSIVGTHGYMAPEMLALQKNGLRGTGDGYSRAVDFWGLGCIMVKLLTGKIAFRNEEVARLATGEGDDDGFESHNDAARSGENALENHVEVEGCGEREGSHSPPISPVPSVGQDSFEVIPAIAHNKSGKYPCHGRYLQDIFQRLDNLSASLPFDCYDVISKFLEVKESERLGSGKGGSKAVVSHPFFNGVQWSLLAQKHVAPPFLPAAKVATFGEYVKKDSFADVMSELGLDSWQTYLLNDCEQQTFETWDYICPEVIKLEIDAADEFSRTDLAFRDYGAADAGSLSRMGHSFVNKLATLGATRSMDYSTWRYGAGSMRLEESDKSCHTSGATPNMSLNSLRSFAANEKHKSDTATSGPGGAIHPMQQHSAHDATPAASVVEMLEQMEGNRNFVLPEQQFA